MLNELTNQILIHRTPLAGIGETLSIGCFLEVFPMVDSLPLRPMDEARPETCSLCSTEISPAQGTRFVEVTPERNGSPRLFHVDCFVAARSGRPRDGAIWTYRIMSKPASAEASP